MVKKTSKKTGPGSEQFQLRLPDGMRKRLAEVAEREGRSMNVVIVTALAMYFENQDAAPKESQSVATALKDLRDRLANQDQKLTELIKKADTGELVQLLKQKIK
jgi:predicted DNA-binding protein